MTSTGLSGASHSGNRPRGVSPRGRRDVRKRDCGEDFRLTSAPRREEVADQIHMFWVAAQDLCSSAPREEDRSSNCCARLGSAQ